MGKAFQQPGMGINNYLAALKDLATQCEYTVNCNSCNAATDYSEEVISDQLAKGLSDEDILDVLIGDEKTNRTLQEMVVSIARKEQAKMERGTVSYVNNDTSAVNQSSSPQASTPPLVDSVQESHMALLILRRGRLYAQLSTTSVRNAKSRVTIDKRAPNVRTVDPGAIAIRKASGARKGTNCRKQTMSWAPCCRLCLCHSFDKK